MKKQMDSLNNGWIKAKECRPMRKDGDEEGYVLVWHVYQGAMLARWNHISNPYVAYWMPIRHITASQWILATERKPTKAEADFQSCVLAKTTREGIKVTGCHQFYTDSTFTAWLPLPEPPSDYRELRRME